MLGSVRLRGHGRAHFPLLRAAHLPGRAARLLTRRSDALLELANALLCAPAIPSLAHLSLEVVHQRGWGSTYAALAHGRVDVQALRDLLARHPLHDGEPIYAVDVSTWPLIAALLGRSRGRRFGSRSAPSATAPSACRMRRTWLRPTWIPSARPAAAKASRVHWAGWSAC